MLWRSPALSNTLGVFGTHERSVLRRKYWNSNFPRYHGSTNSRMLQRSSSRNWQHAGKLCAIHGNHFFKEYSRIPDSSLSSLVVIALHLTTLYIEPVTQFLGMAPLKWKWQWTVLFSLTLFLLPLNLAINSHPEDD